MKFFKFSGSGNDFILIDQNIVPDFIPEKEIVIEMCARGTGIGADGFLYFLKSKENDFDMRYFNSDGSEGFLCANGARCAVKYAQFSKRIEQNAKFFCCGKKYTAKINEDNSVTINLNEPSEIELEIEIKFENSSLRGSFINTGTRHTVINITELNEVYNNRFNELENIPVDVLGKGIRNLPQFLPEGTNVNFIDIQNEVIRIRTFEKGVENETLSCGTGITAAAIISFLKGNVKPPVTIIPKSNDKLIVNFDYINSIIKNISLTGPAKLIFTGEYNNK
ncbi:MAG: diaminopimelate epimerase [Ignavibacteria bacterium]|nr:diaminopimelate epimerase [Ignavibacteria bacterium]